MRRIYQTMVFFKLHQLFQELHKLSGTKPGVLSLAWKFSDKYIPKSVLEVFPTVLKSLHKPSCNIMSCWKCVKSLAETAECVEKETRAQSKSKLWFKHEQHHPAVYHTDPTNPTQNLVKSISYPLELSFDSQETDNKRIVMRNNINSASQRSIIVIQ